MDISSSFKHTSKKLWLNIKVSLSEFNKVKLYINKYYSIKNKGILFEKPIKNIENKYQDILFLVNNGSKNIKYQKLIKEYLDLIKFIEDHNESLNNLEKECSNIKIDTKSFKKAPLALGINYLNSYSQIIDKINKYEEYSDNFININETINNYEKCALNYQNIISKILDYFKNIENEFKATSIITIDDEIKNYLNEMVTLSNDNNKNDYSTYINEYNQLNDKISIHNNSLNKLEKDINHTCLNYDEIIKNPYTFNKILAKKCDEIITKLECFNNITGKFKDFKDLVFKIKSNYSDILNQYNILNHTLKILKETEDIYLDKISLNQIKELINKYNEELSQYKKLYYDISIFNDLNQILDSHNDMFINSHLNDSIFDNINGKSLDIDQRKSVLCNEISELTVAGAGSGKTLTICGKVKYLLDVLHVDKKDILLLSFSKNSANDLEKKLSKISDNLKASTFHALGLEILNIANNEKQTVNDQDLSQAVNEYFQKEIFNDPKAILKILNYYSLYMEDDSFAYEEFKDLGELYAALKSKNYITLKKKLIDLCDDPEVKKTVKKEIVKSYQELVIANYYFINGIRYEYEAPYKEVKTSTIDKREYLPDFTLKDYGIYHEHYGIDRHGNCKQYPPNEAIKYKETMDWKRKLHEEVGTICLETYSYQFDEGTIFDDLNKQIDEYGIERKPLALDQIKNVLLTIYKNKQFESLIKLFTTFISLYKAQYRDDKQFDIFKREIKTCSYDNNRTRHFLDICKDIYNYYMKKLRDQKKIDFDDMILMATDRLNELDGYKYKYIIVDEFQDISYSRMKFLKELINHGNSKLYAVGDDWQAIYRFTGCDINIFLKFNDYFEAASINNISTTHRNSAELQEIVEPFIKLNPEQFNKHLHSEIHLNNPVRLLYCNAYNKASMLFKILRQIKTYNTDADVLLLGRNNKDIESIFKCLDKNDYQQKGDKIIFDGYESLNIKYKTVHASKGLESEYVILINAEDTELGFPNKIEDDQLLSLVLADNGKFPLAEERRLFYVALTRTKKITYILVDEDNPSMFIDEIIDKCYLMDNNKNINNENIYKCPICGSGKLLLVPLKNVNGVQRKAFYRCSNYPYCTYTNFHPKAVEGKMRCPVCGDYMLKLNGKYGPFYHCTNKFCGKNISITYDDKTY